MVIWKDVPHSWCIVPMGRIRLWSTGKRHAPRWWPPSLLHRPLTGWSVHSPFYRPMSTQAWAPAVRNNTALGHWVAQLGKFTTLAQVIISRFVGSSPETGSVLTALSLEPVLFRFCVSLSLCPSMTDALSLSLKNK